MKIAFIVKGVGSKGARLAAALSRARPGVDPESVIVRQTRYAGHATELAREFSAEVDYLIAVGGDGTLHELLNGALQTNDSSPGASMPILGVLPRGTANDFSRSLALDGTVDQLFALIQEREHRMIDVLRIRTNAGQGQTRSCYYLNVADIGIGADVVRRVNKSKKRLGSNVTFLSATIKALLGFKSNILAVRSDSGLAWEGNSLALVIANGRYFGSGLCIAPEAKIDDGLLDVTLVGEVSLLDFMFKFGKLKRGERIEHPQITYHRASRLEVESRSENCWVEADGELFGRAPLEVEVLPAAIPFLLPGS